MRDAAAGNPEERCRSCFEPRRSRDPVGGLFARKPTAKQWQGILETAHRTPRRYGKTRRACITSSFRAFGAGAVRRGTGYSPSATSAAHWSGSSYQGKWPPGMVTKRAVGDLVDARLAGGRREEPVVVGPHEEQRHGEAAKFCVGEDVLGARRAADEEPLQQRPKRRCLAGQPQREEVQVDDVVRNLARGVGSGRFPQAQAARRAAARAAAPSTWRPGRGPAR